MNDANAKSLDVPFVVPATHRLRFTDDVFGCDQEVLAALLESSGERIARVQFWLDESLATARPDLEGLIGRFLAQHRDRFEPTGNVQIVPGGEVVKNDIHILERMLKVFHAADL